MQATKYKSNKVEIWKIDFHLDNAVCIYSMFVTNSPHSGQYTSSLPPQTSKMSSDVFRVYRKGIKSLNGLRMQDFDLSSYWIHDTYSTFSLQKFLFIIKCSRALCQFFYYKVLINFLKGLCRIKFTVLDDFIPALVP